MLPPSTLGPHTRAPCTSMHQLSMVRQASRESEALCGKTGIAVNEKSCRTGRTQYFYRCSVWPHKVAPPTSKSFHTLGFYCRRGFRWAVLPRASGARYTRGGELKTSENIITVFIAVQTAYPPTVPSFISELRKRIFLKKAVHELLHA